MHRICFAGSNVCRDTKAISAHPLPLEKGGAPGKIVPKDSRRMVAATGTRAAWRTGTLVRGEALGVDQQAGLSGRESSSGVAVMVTGVAGTVHQRVRTSRGMMPAVSLGRYARVCQTYSTQRETSSRNYHAEGHWGSGGIRKQQHRNTCCEIVGA